MDQRENREQTKSEPYASSEANHPRYYATPGHLRAAAYLCGIETEPVERARVLELGCRNGRGLQAFALAYPEAKVVGIDIFSDVIELGRQEIQELGIVNLDLLPLDYTDIDATLGQFDYIIVRDEYTWAPAAVRDAILRICAQNLAHNGIAYIGYHTAPGWKAGDIVRDAIQLHAHSATSMEDLRARAGAMLGLMSDGLATDAEDRAEIRAAAQRLLAHPDYYINTDFLNRGSAACYLLDMVGEAQAVGLAYVADAIPRSEQSASYGHQVQLQNSLLAFGQSWPLRQQYLDFAVNRKFRRSLFMHEASAAVARPGIDRERTTDLNFACGLKRRMSPTLPAQPKVDFICAKGGKVSFSDMYTVAACDALSGVWPQTLSYAEIEAATRHVMPGSGAEAHRDAVLSALDALMATGELRIHRGPGPYDRCNASRIGLLAPLELHSESSGKTTRQIDFNLWGDAQHIRVDRSPAMLIDLFKEVELGETEILGQHPELVEFIEHLKWHGLLIGPDHAWAKYYATVLALPSGVDVKTKLHLLPGYVGHFLNSVRHDSTLRMARPADKLERPPVKLMRQLQTLRQQGKYSALEDRTQSFTRRFPQHDYGWHMLALAKKDQGNKDEAIDLFFKAISLRPNDPHLYTGLALSLTPVRGSSMVWVLLGLALWLHCEYAPAYTNLGVHFRDNEQKALGRDCFLRTLELDPNDISARKNLGVVLSELGEIDRAITILRECVDKDTASFSTYSNLLFNLVLSDGITPEALFEEHMRYGQRVEHAANKTKVQFKHTNDKQLDRPLRIGFVSADLRNHAVARFIEPIWRAMDRGAYKIYVYCNHEQSDDITEQLKAYADKWVPVAALTDVQLAQQIHSDDIDILFDLSGHTGHNRLPAFAFKPAPIQITWIGYPGTTGMKAMDYYIVNRHLAPRGMLDDQFTEKLIRMQSSVTFHPAVEGPAVNALPALNAGHFTYGSFNRLNKVNRDVFRAWSEILERVPNSKLIIGHMESDIRGSIRDVFAERGVAADRIEFQQRVTLDRYLELHSKVDLLLDTFPYNGGTTTCYGLWMGVPTLTLAGATASARTGAAIMGALGLPEFIVNNRQDYVEKATQWASDIHRLADIRSSTRGRLTEGSVWGSEKVARSLEAALRQAWHSWCRDEAPKGIELP